MSADQTGRPYIAALLDYAQADRDGVMVLVSRQAIHETVAEVERLVAEINVFRDEAVTQGLVFDKVVRERDAARQKLAEAVEVLAEVHRDCLERAKVSRDGKTVPIGSGAWIGLCAFIASLAAEGKSDG